MPLWLSFVDVVHDNKNSEIGSSAQSYSTLGPVRFFFRVRTMVSIQVKSYFIGQGSISPQIR